MYVESYTEEGAVRNHADRIQALGGKVLIVTGRHSSKVNGSLKDMTDTLDGIGISYVIYDEVEENPSVETVVKAANLGMDFGADFIIGIGGGSPMDASKAIAQLMYHVGRCDAVRDGSTAVDVCGSEGSMTKTGVVTVEAAIEIMYNPANTDHYPIVAVPTTCGTGSEATGVSVITRHDLRTKKSLPQKIYPALALLDPGYLTFASDKVLRDTAIDAMGHMIESYINTTATDESRKDAVEGLGYWRKARAVMDGSRDMRDLTNMLIAANYGGKAISVTGTSIPHALSYRLTYELGMPHGMAIGVFEPGFMKYADEGDVRSKPSPISYNVLNTE